MSNESHDGTQMNYSVIDFFKVDASSSLIMVNRNLAFKGEYSRPNRVFWFKRGMLQTSRLHIAKSTDQCNDI